MTETSEEASGLDRRSLIKKGLVIGGAATVLPVISTFNAPAFAASAQGKFYVMYAIPAGGGAPVRGDTGETDCAPSGWTTVGPTADPGEAVLPIAVTTANVGPLGVGGDYVFTLDSDCTFTQVPNVHTGGLTPGCSFGTLDPGNQKARVDHSSLIVVPRQAYFVIFCT
jgi:hypothetical protein